MAMVWVSVFAGTPQGAPAFFVASGAEWKGVAQSDSLSLYGFEEFWLVRGSSAGQSLEISLRSESGNLDYLEPLDKKPWIAREVVLHSNLPRMEVAYTAQGSQYDVGAHVQAGSSDELGGGFSLGWHIPRWELQTEATRDFTHPFRFSWSDTLFPKDAGKVAGDYSSDRWAMQFMGKSTLPWVTLETSLGLFGSTPMAMTKHYGLRDSSFWLEGSAGAGIRLRSIDIDFRVRSISGILNLTGQRLTDGDSRRFFSTQTTWDYSDGWLTLTPLRKGSILPTSQHPLERLTIPRLEPSVHQPNLEMGLGHLRARLLEPPIEDRVGTFDANRLLDPGLATLFGFTFYRQTLLASATADLWGFHLQGSVPYWKQHAGAWLGAGLSHYLGQVDYQARVRTANMFSSTSQNYDGAARLDAFLFTGQVGFGLRDHPNGHWTVKAYCEQLAPLAAHLWHKGKDLLASSPNLDTTSPETPGNGSPGQGASNSDSGRGSGLFRNGFRAALQLEYAND